MKFSDGNENADVYHDTYEWGKTSGPDRLIIAPAGGQIELMCRLLGMMSGPFGFLYVLVVSRRGEEAEGRYQLENSLTLEELVNLLRDFRDFFEGDGRHPLMVRSHGDGGMLYYDRHDLIYAYGDVERYVALLEEWGFRRERVEVPDPHGHHYHPEFDGEVQRLLGRGSWLEFPLVEGQDV